MKRKYHKNLEVLRNKINKYKKISSDDIKKLLEKRNKLQAKETMKSKLVPINQLKDWSIEKKIFHKSHQFFQLKELKWIKQKER